MKKNNPMDDSSESSGDDDDDEPEISQKDLNTQALETGNMVVQRAPVMTTLTVKGDVGFACHYRHHPSVAQSWF
jgi:hypothetical protein